MDKYIVRHTFRRTERQTYIYSQRNIQQTEGRHTETHSDGQKGRHTYTIRQTFRRTERDTYRDIHSDGQKDRHTYTVRETFRRKEGRHTETHIQTDRRAGIHIQSEKHSGGKKGYIQRHTFRRTEGRTYIYSQRNFQQAEGRHTETHIQTDRRTYMHLQSEKHSGGQK